jgi:hypothetical protein
LHRAALYLPGRPVLLKWVCLVIGSGVLLCLTGFFTGILEEIDIVAIRDLQVRKEGGQNILDAVITIRNTTQKYLKLIDCDFDLAFVLPADEDIRLGQVFREEILLVQGAGSENTDTDLLLSIDLGSDWDVQALYEQLLPTANVILTESKPEINLHLKAQFNLAVRSQQAWHYGNGFRIDWIVTPAVERMVLFKFLQAIAPADVAVPTPVPVVTPPVE